MAEDMEGCVMLALSTFRKSEKAIYTAIQKAKVIRKLFVVYVADVNLARYFVGAEYGLSPGLKDTCEANMLNLHEAEGRTHVVEIAAKADFEGIEMGSIVRIGRFAVICLEAIKKVKPSLIVTTRSQRPEWVKKFFGAPVDELIAKAECPVVVV